LVKLAPQEEFAVRERPYGPVALLGYLLELVVHDVPFRRARSEIAARGLMVARPDEMRQFSPDRL
jgi:hypothetical protein